MLRAIPSLMAARFAAGLDPDAQAFITAAGITNATQKNAINQFVIDLKSYSIWTKFYALYPFVGGTATTHKYNLVNPQDTDAAYRMVFNGTITHNANGITPGGTAADFADTKLNGSIVLSKTNSGYSFYSRTNVDGLFSDYGSVIDAEVLTQFSGNFYSDIQNSVDRATFAQANSLGLFNGNLGSSNIDVYVNGSLAGSKGSAATQNYANTNLVFCSGNGGAGVFNRPSPRNLALGAIHQAFTSTEAANLSTAVTTYETTLGRNV